MAAHIFLSYIFLSGPETTIKVQCLFKQRGNR
jgi:hypothetical protein